MRNELPAPYRSPWNRLAGDLQAVGADIALRLRRLWRLNREGQLPHPRGWPESLSSLFWPLLLVGVLSLLALLGSVLWRGSEPTADGTATGPGSTVTAVPDASEPRQVDPEVAGRIDLPATVPEPTSPLTPSIADREAEEPTAVAPEPIRPAAPEPTASTGAATRAQTQAKAQSPLAVPPSAPVPPVGSSLCPEPLEPDAVSLSDRRGLIEAVCFSDASQALLLQLRARPQAEEAEAWLNSAREQGIDGLELRLVDGRLIGRQALIGDGMILGNL
ncbi:hypothetical protein EVJ50_03495 [Synechococcus sp. RSCCF101]|uniref:hypothetical protein n=1 Tax=Synechococcus sp. RSCCF101 TaxID=2511069 RepID=UPI0012463A7C|nr:hypothetical protein [Synechococcus sp. RSCCF101]QEY31456.1 hypothetical protein EVJ50_03495 [Synechococcus sp. RSCCF101]